jgi:hypothetical protein
MSDDFDRHLRTAFPQTTDAAVVRTLATAVALADDVRRNTPWLANLIGSDHRGLLRRAAAMWQFEADCVAGNLPFEASIVPNTTASCHLLMIRSGGYEAHIVRTESEGAFPKDAPIRQDKSLSNQGDLFTDPKLVPLDAKLKSVANLYAWLSFDADTVGSLTHVCWCMPESGQKSFLSRFNILRKGSSGLSLDDHAPPPPDLSGKIKFRNDLERFIGDPLANKKK